MTDLGIKSYAASVPRLRMDRASIAAAHAWALPSLRGLGKGERSFCSWDEDSITMSVEAVRGCLRGAQTRKRENRECDNDRDERSAHDFEPLAPSP